MSEKRKHGILDTIGKAIIAVAIMYAYFVFVVLSASWMGL